MNVFHFFIFSFFSCFSSFSFLFLSRVARNPIIFGLNCFKISGNISFHKNHFFEPSREEGYPLEASVRTCTACSHTCCAWSAGLTSLCSARRRPALVISLSTDASVLRVFCFGLWVYIPPKLLEQRSALLLSGSHRCVGHVPRGQWALLDADMFVVTSLHVWWSLALVVGTPRAHESPSPHGFRREPHHEVFCAAQSCTCPRSGS